MKKFKVILLIIILSPLIAGIYGVLDSQLAYTISPEYFTKFKFVRAGIASGVNDRYEINKIGFYATWWIGLYMGIGISILSLIHSSSRQMRKISLQSMLIATLVTFLMGMVGLGYGFVILSSEQINYFEDWFIPPDLQHYSCYIAVYSMHNFSFIGGAIGLMAAAGWHFFKREKVGRK